MQRSSRFWDRIARRYARSPVADGAAYRKKLAIARGYLAPHMEVLEFGCGTGSTAIALAPHVKHIRAIDFSAKMLEFARGKAEAGSIANVTFERSTLEELDAPDAGFDAVMGHSILHLLDDWNAAIAKVHSLLKPGGVFISSTACLGDFMKYFRLIAPVGRVLGLLPLIRVFTKLELLDSLASAGFEIAHQWQPGERKPVFIVARKAG